MTETCPVNDLLMHTRDAVTASRLPHPRERRIAEEIRELLEDVAWGRAGADHLPAVQRLAGDLSENGSPQATALATSVTTALNTAGEVFQSHVTTHNCATGDCIRLAPAPCQTTCPAGIDVPTYVSLIGLGKDAQAIEVIRKDNPFPWVCGLVCTRPCEFMCVRGRIDSPVSIKSLKAFAAERALSDRLYKNPEKAPPNGKRVCVVGAGPGGLSAAYYLALMGYEAEIIEALSAAGGMLMVGIPRYRLPREVIDREVAMIRSLGVKFRFNTRFGVDVDFDSLKAEGFDAFLIAVGAHKSFTLNIPGETDFPQVRQAIDFLRQTALGERESPGRRVIVIGGGNVAIDAARTALRLGTEAVIIAYRRTRSEMPADVEEVEQAEEEGIEFAFLTVPRSVVGEAGRVTGLSCLRAELVDAGGGGRKKPVPIEGSEHILAADCVIGAIGQRIAQENMVSLPNLSWTRRNTIDVDMVTMQTSMEGIFAVGDAVTGPATVIEAIGGGKRAAEAIDRHLTGIPQPTMPPVPVRRGRVENMEVPAGTKMALKRPHMPLLDIDRRRITFQQAELGLSENQVREEARRCLRCDICRRCGDCVSICRDKMGIDALRLGYLDFDHPGRTDFRETAETCITCGACAANCPNEAMRMTDTDTERILSLCGIILNRQPLSTCAVCGEAMPPARYLEYIRRRTDSVGKTTDTRPICENCQRKQKAGFHTDIHPVPGSR